MKRRTLNQTWVLCLRMWRWIAANWKEGANIYTLKEQWIHNNGFGGTEIESDCFFCDFCIHCPACPGKLVDPDFYCENEKYDYETKPKTFYKELLRLNRIRKGK